MITVYLIKEKLIYVPDETFNKTIQDKLIKQVAHETASKSNIEEGF